MRYYKIFHYSVAHSLSIIDPEFSGSGVDLRKRGNPGLNKSFYYIENKPEPCVYRNGLSHCYEIYMPYEWRALIYDLGTDSLNLANQVRIEFESRHNRLPYEAEWMRLQQQFIKDLGYKGIINSMSSLSHAIALFYALPTEKPKGNDVIYDWNNTVIEDNRYVDSIQHLPQLGLFAAFKNVEPSNAIDLKTSIRAIC